LTQTPQNNTRTIVTIIAAVTVMGLSLSLSIPLVSLALERRGFGSDVIGYMGAFPALAFLFATPFVPKLASVFGASKMLWTALILCSGSILALAFTENLYVWFLLRLGIGTGMSILFLISETWINQVANEETRGRTIGIYVAFLTCGFALGPVLINVLGSEGQLPFIIASMIVASAGLFFFSSGDNYPIMSGHSRFSVFSFIKLAPLICAAALLVAFFDGTVLTLLPIYGVKSGMTAGTAVLMTSLLLGGNILLQMPIGWLADNVGREKVILVCGILGLIGSLLLPLLISSPILLWPMLVIWGGAVVGTYTLALVLMGEKFKGAELVTANAAAGVLWGVGSLIGPAAGGLAMEIYEPHGMPFVFAIICFLFVCIAIWQTSKKAAVNQA